MLPISVCLYGYEGCHTIVLILVCETSYSVLCVCEILLEEAVCMWAHIKHTLCSGRLRCVCVCVAHTLLLPCTPAAHLYIYCHIIPCTCTKYTCCNAGVQYSVSLYELHCFIANNHRWRILWQTCGCVEKQHWKALHLHFPNPEVSHPGIHVAHMYVRTSSMVYI